MINEYAVVGGGISGLLLSALLTKAGKTVILCEKNSVTGGYLQNITDSKVPYGAHHIGIPDKKLFVEVFEALGISLDSQIVEANEVRVMLGEETYEFSLRLTDLEKFLVQAFPLEEGAIKSFIEYIQDFSEALLSDSEMLIKKFFMETALISFEKFLEKYFKDQKLKRLLVLLGPGYAGVDERDSAFTFISLLATYGNGAYYLNYYGEFLIKDLENKIREGKTQRIVTQCMIIDIEKDIDRNLFILKSQTGETIIAKNVILACYPIRFINHLSKRLNIKSIQLNKICKLTVGPSAYRLYFKVNEPLENQEILYIPYPINHSMSMTLKDNPFVMTTIKKRSGYANIMITFTCEEKIERVNIEKKMFEAREFIAKIYQIEPEDIECMLYIDPDSREKSTLNKNGSVFGWKRDITNNLNSNLLDKIENYIPGLFQIGHWSSNFGVFGSIYNVKKCFAKIMGDF